MNDKLKPPGKSASDHMHLIARAGIASVPLVGGAGLEIFNAVVMPPLENRRQVWVEEVARSIRELEEQHKVLPDTLAQNERFISVVANATNIAIRAHENVKLDALRNAITNVALDTSPHSAREHLFLRLIDDLSGPQILCLFGKEVWVVDEEVPAGAFFGGLSRYKGAEWLATELLDDLIRRGLVKIDRFENNNKQHVTHYKLTEVGEQFRQFISDEHDV